MRKLILLNFLLPLVLFAQEPNKSMVASYDYYKKIQNLIHEEKELYSEDQRQELKELVIELNKTLNDFQSYDKKERLPAFQDNLEQLTNALSQVERQLGNKDASIDWSIWRLKAISTNCQTCHSNFSTEIRFKSSEVPDDLDDFEKAEFLLATRQFEDAEAKYWNYILNGSFDENGFFYVFNRWIDLQVRILQTPENAAKKIKELIDSKPKISEYELDEVKSWLSSINTWIKNGGKISKEFIYNKKLISNLINSKSPVYEEVDQLNLLRASAGFNKLYESGSATEQQKKEILYYLGLIYAKTPTFFIYELPELYLKRCIKNYPKTKEAQNSFNVLRDIIEDGFTGSGGTHIDQEAKQELEELYKLAYK